MTTRSVLWKLGLGVWLGVTLAAAPVAAQPTSVQQIADRIAKEYGVKVLKTAEGQEDGKPVLFVTVMNEGGNFNNAFQVSTLAVDPATGELIPQQDMEPATMARETRGDASGRLIRLRSLREPPR